MVKNISVDGNQNDLWSFLAAEKRPLVIYGMGNGADKLIAQLDRHGIPYADVFASDGFVRGQLFHGQRVLSFAEVKEKYDDFLILLAFATSRPEVLSMVDALAASYDLLMPDLPVVGDHIWDADFEKAHQAEIDHARALFCDADSLALFDAVLAYKRTGRINYLRGAPFTTDALPLQFPCDCVITYIDAGAYRGETVISTAKKCPHLRFCAAIEPDRRSFTKLSAFAAQKEIPQIFPIYGAVWNEDGQASFHDSGNRNSSLQGASYQHSERTVPTLRLDSLAYGAEDTAVFRRTDFIKYDVEGAEAEALEGSAELIRLARPIVAVSVYHRTEDLFSLPLLLQKICPDYDFYLTRRDCLPAWELTVCAIPKERALQRKDAHA